MQKEMERTYIRIESTLLLAVTCYKMDRKEWKNLLQEAVSEAESYHFVRILTKEAGLWLPLLKKKQGRDTLDRSTLSQTGAGRRKKDGADVPWISQDKSGGRSHTFRYRTEDSADAGRGRFHEQDSRTAGAGGSDGEVSLSGNLPETRCERKSSGGE